MLQDNLEVCLVLCTFPDEETACGISRTLVEEQLAACVNLAAGVTSIYRWQGQVETAGEVLAVIKTTRAACTALEARLQALHPYDVPEFLILPVAAGAAAYLEWVRASVRAPG